MAGIDYGNARICALRARLLDRGSLRRLAEAANATGFLAGLEREPDWTESVHAVTSPGTPPEVAARAVVEHHHSRRLSALVRWYDGETRSLVEALLMPFDLECALAQLRRRRAESPEIELVSGGALLDARELSAMGRGAGLAPALRSLVAHGLITAVDARRIAVEAAAGAEWHAVESSLRDAVERARRARAAAPTDDAELLLALLDRERADRAAVVAEARANGLAAAAIVERMGTLARLDDVARRGRRDTLGLGTPAGYVAALEAQAIRLRAVLEGVLQGTHDELLGQYLDDGTDHRWVA